MVLFFRRRLPEAMQQGWETYWDHCWPMFDEREELSAEEIAAAQQASKRDMIRWSLVGWVVLVIGDVVAWRYTGETRWLWQPLWALAFIAFIILFVFSGRLVIKTRGRLFKNRPQQKIRKTAAISFLAAIILPIAIMAFRIFPHDSLEEGVAMIGTMLVLLVPFFLDFRRQYREFAKWDREAGRTAAELYLNSSAPAAKEP